MSVLLNRGGYSTTKEVAVRMRIIGMHFYDKDEDNGVALPDIADDAQDRHQDVDTR